MNVKKVVKKIEAYRGKMMALTDEQLQAKTDEFKERVKKESLDKMLPEVFAVVREASRRVLGMEPYPVQMMGGIVLFNGQIAEMKTGEGKTLVAAMPSYLMALTGKGVHVVTVNDYLAKRDADEIGQVHRFLGLTVGCVLADMPNQARKAAYNCDITYVTNSELGFDYLRDNMAMKLEEKVQRGLHFAIIDEVDSILIDEARTPLIISGEKDKSMELYHLCDVLAKKMVRGETSGELTKMDILAGNEVTETGDYIVNEKDKLVYLTEEGTKKVEEFFSLENYGDDSNLEIQHHMMIALKAQSLMHRDIDYVVRDGEVLIVDEFTGRIMNGRRYSDGLHQAIEAKEGVEVKQESQTLATITYQNFFNKYDRKSGMTGTAMTEAKEFRNIYDMKVISIPTNKPVIRKDMADVVYLTKKAKYRAIVDAIKAAHVTGQPILVGTVSIEVSELLSDMLKSEGIPHEVLNAKQNEREAEIVSLAGQFNAVTIATNMAGRGTDIKLDEKAREAGGLFVIGTERHESRRIDNQLRGRSGRQGDPGKSIFYISLEDDVMRLFGGERTLRMFKSMGLDENAVLTHRSLSKAIENAQKKIEGNNYGIRKNLLDFDEVNNQQRDAIYAKRDMLLSTDNVHEDVLRIIRDVMADLVDEYCVGKTAFDWDLDGLEFEMKDLTKLDFMVDVKARLKVEDVEKQMTDWILARFAEKQEENSDEENARIEHIAMLRSIDTKWTQELTELEQARQGIGLMGYGQKDPVVEYKLQAYELYEIMIKEIHKWIVRMLFRAKVIRPVMVDDVSENVQTVPDTDVVDPSLSDDTSAVLDNMSENSENC
jgi:preprotein translocase subunit SecA